MTTSSSSSSLYSTPATGGNLYLDWNACAVHLMREGKYDEAIPSLRNALQHLRAQFAVHTADGCWKPTRTSDPQGSSSAGQLASVPAHQESVQERDLDDEGSVFAFYPRAFLIAMDAATPRSSLQPDRFRILTVLLFNLGLAHHLQAQQLSCPTASHESVRHAMSCYQSAMHVIKSSCCHQQQQRGSDDTAADEQDGLGANLHCLLLALVNNMGSLHSRLGNFCETRHCITLLSDLLTYPCTQDRVPASDYCHFYQSIFIFLDTCCGQDNLVLSPAA